MRWLLALLLAGCFSPAAYTDTCAPDDVDCWTTHLVFVDDSGNTTNAVIVDEATVEAISTRTGSSAAPSLFTGSASFDFSNGTVVDGTTVVLTELLDVAFSDPDGCSPVLGLTVSHGAGARSKHTGCFPGIHDMKTSGPISAFFSFSASATAPASLSLDVVPVSNVGCASIDDPATLVVSATAVAGVFVTMPLAIAPPPSTSGSGDNTCPGGLLASTLECDPIGRGGNSSECISAASYMQATGMPLPAECTPAGVSGCENSTGTLVHPCCPGLTCEVGAACGDASNATGGTCH